MSTTVLDTDGATVATIVDKEVDVSTVLSLPGRGYPGYGSYLLSSIWWVLENFASETAPDVPVRGMWWYDKVVDRPKYWDGSSWISVGGLSNSVGMQLDRMGPADNINMATTGSVNLYTGPADTQTFVTGFMLIPRSGAAPTGAPAQVQLEITASSGDVMDKVVLSNLTSDAKFFYQGPQGVNRIVAAAEIIKLNKVVAIGGGSMSCDAYLFGRVVAA